MHLHPGCRVMLLLRGAMRRGNPSNCLQRFVHFLFCSVPSKAEPHRTCRVSPQRLMRVGRTVEAAPGQNAELLFQPVACHGVVLSNEVHGEYAYPVFRFGRADQPNAVYVLQPIQKPLHQGNIMAANGFDGGLFQKFQCRLPAVNTGQIGLFFL